MFAHSQFSGLLVRGVLLLRGIQLDFEGFFRLFDFVDFAVRLVPFSYNLDADFPPGDLRDLDLAFLVGLHLEGGADGLAELDHGAALDEADDHAGAVHRLAGRGLDDNGEPGHVGGMGCRREEQQRGHTEKAKESAAVTHIPIIRWGRTRTIQYRSVSRW